MPGRCTETYGLADGTTISADIVSFNEVGVILKTPDDKYTDRMLWTQFSQEGLESFAQNPKVRPMVEPFINPPAPEKSDRNANIKVQDVSRLTLPPKQGLIGAMMSSSVGFFMLLMIYLANLYAGYEVAVCRARPVPVVMGVSAVLPLIGPAVFYALPTNMQGLPTEVAAAQAAEAAAASPAGPAAPAAPAEAAPAGSDPAAAPAAATASAPPVTPGSRIARPAPAASVDTSLPPEFEGIQISAVPIAAKETPAAQVFKRGQFTFNRRFFETKFAGFTQVSRSDADKQVDLVVKSAQGEFVVERILRIGTGDLDLEVIQVGMSQVILVAFADIQEITLKPKTA